MAATACTATAVLGGVRLSPVFSVSRSPSPSSVAHRRPIAFSGVNLSDAHRFSSLKIRASSDESSSSIQGDELLSDLKQKWDSLENKSAVFIYGGGAIVAIWLSSILVGAINSVPLLPKIMELVGLGYTGWFVYRYLLFKSSRKELADDIEDLKKKIAGTGE